jgi:hypothetical protein
LNQPLQFSEVEIERALDCAAAECGMVPTPSQHLAAKQVLTSTITKISGTAGTGRTQTFRLLSVAWKNLTAGSSDILLLAYTPKAASCLGQIVGMEATTLHRAFDIGVEGAGWRSTTRKNHGLVLFEDDLHISRPDLIEALINACPGAHIAISCDSEQLPSPIRISLPSTTFVLTERFRAPEAA